MKTISMNKTPKVFIERLPEDEVSNLFKIHSWVKIDRQKAIKTIARIESAGFLTFSQYTSLYGERPYLVKNKWAFIKLSGNEWIQDKIILLSWKWKMNMNNFTHNYINNQNLIKKNKEIQGNVIFDQRIVLTVKSPIGNKWLRPDGIIFKGNKIYFIETDLGTERWKILVEKGKLYQDYFIQEMNEHGMEIDNVRIILYTTTQKRINRIREKWIFSGLELLNLIEYSLN